VKIKWICDVKGWAYDNIANSIIKHTRQHKHTKVFISEKKEFNTEKDDVIILFSPRYFRYLKNQEEKKTIVRLDGFRAFGDDMKLMSIENLRNWSWSVVNNDLFRELEKVGWSIFRVYRSDEDAQQVIREKEKCFEVKMVQNVDGVKLLQEPENSITRIGGIRTFKGDTHRFDRELRSCYGVIATNNELYRIAIESGAKNVWLIPNGVDLEVFRPREKKRHGQFTVGFAGNIGFQGAAEYKGYDISKAAAKVAGARWEERLYGKNQIPHKEMVKKFYHQIDVLVLASINEGCNNTVMEALACGVPVLITKVGYHGEIIQDGEQGFFIKRDILDISKKIEKMMKDRDLHKEMSEKARKFAEEHHDIKKISKKYDEIFNMVNKGEVIEKKNGKVKCMIKKDFWAYGRPWKKGKIIEIEEKDARKFRQYISIIYTTNNINT